MSILVRTYYEDSNGKLGLETVYLNVKEYYDNGKLRCEYRTRYGKKDGEYREWYENGNLRLQDSYIDGIFHGKLKKFYKDGCLKEEMEYKFGRLCKYEFFSIEGEVLLSY